MASITKRPPVIARTSSCFVITATIPRAPPAEREPVSPIKTIAGGALNHKNPRPAPTRAPQKMASSPVPGIKGIWR